MTKVLYLSSLLGLLTSILMLHANDSKSDHHQSSKKGTGFLCQVDSACDGTSHDCAETAPGDGTWTKVIFYHTKTCHEAAYWPFPCSTTTANTLCWEAWTWYGTGCGPGAGDYYPNRVTSCQ